MPYAVPLPQIVMCRGADITPKTHTVTAHSEIQRYTNRLRVPIENNLEQQTLTRKLARNKDVQKTDKMEKIKNVKKKQRNAQNSEEN